MHKANVVFGSASGTGGAPQMADPSPVEAIVLDLLTEDDVAKQLHVSVASLRRWRLLNRGPQFHKVGALVRYRPEDVEAWLAGQPTGGASLERSLAARF